MLAKDTLEEFKLECEGVPFLFFDGSKVRSAWITSSIADPLTHNEDEVYTLWLNGEKVTESQEESTGIAVLNNELLWTTEAENGNAL